MSTKQIEDAYPLSPTQQGILFHALYAPDSGMYVEQLACVLRGELNLAAFAQSWQYLIDRHPILRSAFVWKNIKEPAQAVGRRVKLPLRSHDWRTLPTAEQQARLAAFLVEDRRRGFELTAAPLMRLALFRLSESDYRFVWSSHHLLLDGWSLALVLKEVFACYAAFCQGRDPMLERPRPYRDYIAWLQRQDLTPAEAFWRRALRDVTAPTPLVVDHPAAQAVAALPDAATQAAPLAEATTAALQALAREHNLTLNTLVQGAWALLLHRYSGASDVVFGTTVAGRPPELPGIETMVGLFINTLPLRVRIASATPVREWLQQLQAQLVAMRQYEHSPLVQVHGWSEVPRDLPLFESIVVFENYPISSAGLDQGGRVPVEIRDMQLAEQSNYPLTLVAVPGPALLVRINYASQRFDRTTIIRILGHLRTILEGIAARPTQPLAELPLLTAAERAQVLVAWNDTRTGGQRPGGSSTASDDACLHTLIEAQAARTPDAIAVAFDAGLAHDAPEPSSFVVRPSSPMQLTYAELNARANQLAWYLRRLGAGPEARVALCMARSPELLIGLLGVLKAGAAYVPLDPSYPAKRISFMLEDSQASVLITSQDAGRRTQDTEAPPESLPDLGLTIDDLRASPAAIQNPTPDNLAYVIYTSGSTGQPKGAMNTHRGIVNRLRWMQATYGLTADDSVLQKTPISFDVSVWELFWPLLSGARLVLARPGGQRDPLYLAALIGRSRITTVHFVPSMLHVFLDEPDLRGCAGLRRVICSGEALSLELQERFFSRLDAALHNLYGPTEAAIDVTAWTCAPGAGRRTVPIGRPVANTQIYLLDAQLRPLPIGVPGELFIGGVQLARGYLNRPDLTAERFVPCPDEGRTTKDEGPDSSLVLRPSSGDRLYRTGDLARYAADGSIEFLGRIDQQVKLRGVRIEPGEIAAALAAHPAVYASAVVARTDDGEQRLVAYVVPAADEGRTTKDESASSSSVPGPSSFIAELRTFLAERLPSSMVPSAFVVLDALPLTPNGKLDRAALPAPDGQRPAANASYQAPRTPIEELLTHIWADILRVAQVGIDDNFFALGGHSLLATQVISRIRATFQVELPLRSLFDAPTVARLANAIADARRAGPGRLAPPLRPAPREAELPLSFAQQRLWFLDQLAPGNPAYHMPSAIYLDGPLDLAALQRSLNAIVRRHEALRTSFVAIDGRPAQIIAAAQALPLPLLELQALPSATSASLARHLAAQAAQRPFDLARGPLLHIALLRLDNQTHVLLATMHHIISDGWSREVLIRELAALYTAYAAAGDHGGAPPQVLPELPIQYADFAIWQRAWLQGEVLDAQLAYWRTQLADAPLLTLPTDFPRPPIASFAGAQHDRLLPLPLLAALVALSRREGTTLFMTLVAAFQALLGRYSGQDDILVGTPIAGRTRAETEGVLGCFVNTLVLRADLSGNPSFREVARRVRGVCLDAYTYQDLPFEQLVDSLQLARDLRRNPLFDVMFALQNAQPAPLELPELTWRPLVSEVTTTHFDLGLSLVETSAGLLGLLEYRTDLFAAATTARLLRHFRALLEGIVAAPDQRLAALSLLSAAERQQMLVDWNATAARGSGQRAAGGATAEASCMHQLFAAQARRTPDAVASVFEGQHLSYHELDRRANQLAHYLQARGVGPEVLVALCIERSLELVIGLLGIFKAGGTYLPLDPAHPPERLRFMIEDSRTAVIVTATGGPTDTGTRGQGAANLWSLLASVAPDRPVSRAVIDLRADWRAIAAQPATAPPSRVQPAHLAYVIYTSGSTGQPKGVLVEQRQLVSKLLDALAACEFSSQDVVPWIAAATFDIALFELLCPLLVGGTVLVLTAQQVLDLPGFMRLLPQITFMHAVPGLIRPIGRYVREQRLARLGAGLRKLFVGGDLIPPELVAELQAAFPATQLYLGYGPTEATIICATYRVPRGQAVRAALIGSPMPNVCIRLYDRAGQLVPLGVVGEVYIGGAGVARGYLNRPDLTAERFVPCADAGRTTLDDGPDSSFVLHPSSGDRLYRTGDLARWLSDGTLSFVGRLDSQVKVRGYRIELGEVTAALGAHPAVQECVVVARAEPGVEQRLVAYVVPTHDARRTTNDESDPSSVQVPAGRRPSSFVQGLRKHLEGRLPDYMLPAAFVVLDALPLTPHGKIDHAALPAPDAARHARDDAFAAPRTPVEARLAAIWAEVLRLERVGVYDNFFALGGDSILSIQIISRAREAGLQLIPKQLFLHQTIAELAPLVGSAPDVAATQGPVSGPLPLTPIQQHFFAQNPPVPQHFNQALLLTTLRRLDPALLARALAALLAHHDALRLRFTQTADGWQQHNAAHEPQAVLCRVDLAGLAAAAQRPALEAAARDLQRSLDLTDGPLLRAALLDLGADQPGRLLLIVHHLAMDGVSWRILLEDLHHAYMQLVAGQAISLPPKTTSFAHWAGQLLAYAQSEALRQEAERWLALLQPPVGCLPVDRPHGPNINADARNLTITLDADATRALLIDVPPVYRTRINDVLLAALALAYAEWAGASALLLDLEGHGRADLFDTVDLARTVGWFTSLFPVRLELPPNHAPGAVLKAIKEQLRAVPRDGIGYGILRYLSRDTAISARLAALPAPEISFNYLGQVDQALAPDGLFGGAHEASGPTQDSRAPRSHLIDISGVIASGQLHLTWTYSAARHDRATITRLAQAYLAALHALIAHCRAPEAGGCTPSDFPLAALDQATLDRLSSGGSRVEDLYPLSPMQQGMLFHTLLSADPGAYTEHMCCTLRGELSIPAFKEAWQQVVDRHPVLRTSFVWEGLAEPLQIVWRAAALPWQIDDWRRLALAEQEARLDAFLRADHARGFSLSQAPLMRMALFQVAEDDYTFVWSHHHLLLDGWSLPLVFQEVAAGYAAARDGRALQQAQPRPYRDYIAWLRGQDLARAEAFWRGALQGVTAPTSLGIDRPAGAAAAGEERYLEQRHRLSQSDSAALQAFARRHGLTLNTLVQGAWALLLSRYSGDAAVIFGVTVAGRPPELLGGELMVGNFINTLPVRVHLPPHALVLPWLRQLQAQQAELRQYEYSPLVQVQGWSAVPRGLPLFENILVFENYPVGEAVAVETSRPHLAVLNVRAVDRNNYPLTLGVAPGPELSLTLVYDRLRFAGDAITRMAAHYRQLLMALTASPTPRLATLSLLTPAEAYQLQEWSVPLPAMRSFQPVAQLIAAQACVRPDALALADGTDQLSYAALLTRTNQLAHLLRTLGVGPEVPVALALPRSLDLIVALLGVLVAGGAYVPLDLAAPPARLAQILAESSVPLLLTHAALADTLPATWVPPLCLDQLAGELAAQPTTAPAGSVAAEQMAYVIYTSGSTGAPKGVVVPQRGLANMATTMAAALAITPSSRVLQFAPISVDASVFEVLATLGAGAALVLGDSAELHTLLARAQISAVTLPPTVLGLLEPDGLAQLRTVTAAGEAISAELVERWSIGRHFVNAYGPTEATVCATQGPCAAGAPLTIGRPLAGSAVYVLDPLLRSQPIGVMGELYLGGVGLARGYLARPDLTAERFVPSADAGRTALDDGPDSSFALRPASGDRLYRTGDLARWRADGTLEYLGRRDTQVKLRGFRIELGEIEAVLRGHPQVQECVVLARAATTPARGYPDRRLVAYVVPAEVTGDRGQGTGVPRLSTTDDRQWTIDDGMSFESSSIVHRPSSSNDESEPSSFVLHPSSLIPELRAFLAERLPDYMVPAAFVLLERWPLTSYSKIDRNALPAPDEDALVRAGAFVAPRTPVEHALAEIWAEVLGVAQVGVEDNFFMLGGHSLLATQVISRIRAAFQAELPLHSLFDAPTIAGLAEQIAATRRDAPGLGGPIIRSIPRDGKLPLSFAQQRLWFIDQLLPNSAAYNMASAVRLTGPLDLAALQQGLGEILRRHEILRTTFASVDGEPIQVIAPAETLDATPLPLVDLRAQPQQAREAELLERITQETQRPFDLARGPLLRTLLLRLAAQEHALLINMHHIVTDGWSMGVFVRELATLYAAITAGKPSPLPELPIQYADYALWQRAWLQGELRDQQLAYWKNQLAAAPTVLDLPTDRPRPPQQTFRGERQMVQLSASLTADLNALSQREGTTLFMTALAGFATVLFRYTGQADLLIGTRIAGRTYVATEPLIGFFLNALVLRVDLAGAPPFRTLLARVREVALGAYAHQDLPFEELVRALQPARDQSYHPLFQVMFALQNMPLPSITLPNLKLGPVEGESKTAKYDLDFSLSEGLAGLIGMLDSNTDLFDPDRGTRLLRHFQTLLAAAIAAPDRPITTLPLLSAAERHQFLIDWTAPPDAGSSSTPLIAHFAAQVARTPDAIAVACADQQLSYGALACGAAAVAARLRAHGAGPDIPVGVYLDRGLATPLALLAILQAGGTYVPLDPTYPAALLAHILADTQMPLLLTTHARAPQLPPHAARVLCLDALPPAPTAAPTLAVRTHPDQALAIMYTSGSTGQPKGVVLPHRQLLDRCAWTWQRYPFAADEVAAQRTAVNFTPSLPELFAPLLAGVRTVILPDAVVVDPAALLATLHAQRISRIGLVPALLQQLLDHGGDLAHELRQLRLWSVGGEALTSDLLARSRAALPQAVLLNQYGATEVNDALVYDTRDLPLDAERVPLGRPLPHLRAYVLDAQRQLRPIGVAGELHLASAGLARGYLNRPDLTAEQFGPNPFATREDEGRRTKDETAARPFVLRPSSFVRLYATGDLARWRADGTLEYLGRRDGQVKLRGVRIELAGLEALLRRHGGVAEAAVAVYEDVPGHARLVAYVVPTKDEGRTTQDGAPDSSCVVRPSSLVTELREWMASQLPTAMVPATFVLLDALPKTPSGKLDRRALPAPERVRPDLVSAFKKPRTSVEVRLAAIWEQLLDIRPIGITDNFFQLGGHSLLVVRLLSSIQKEFGQNLPLSTFFQGATIAQMAASIEQQSHARPWSALVEIQPEGSRRPFFCVHPASGEALCYVDLAYYLGLDQPFYGLQAPGLSGEQEPCTRVEDAATRYIDAIRQVQPEGPYLLGGWSIGGMIAFEMARQLHAQGQAIALLALFDSGAPVADQQLFDLDDTTILAAIAGYANLPIAFEQLQQLSPEQQQVMVVELATQARLVRPQTGFAQIRHFVNVTRANDRLLKTYMPGIYPGRITFFRATDFIRPQPSWEPFSSQPIEVHDVPGKHVTMIYPPHVRTLAEKLSQCLLAAEEQLWSRQRS
jgi:amino acid adenylation domain-containing protein/non-ribosomal peptide synthase protein (TIGR01720 family)